MIAVNSIDNWIALGLSVLGIAYMIIVIVFPERF